MVFFESVKKMMGWCPNVTQSRYKSSQQINFVNPSQTPSGRSNIEYVQSKNVMFSAVQFQNPVIFQTLIYTDLHRFYVYQISNILHHKPNRLL
ncbi:MAG TPA: DUF1673 family protein [Methanosarcinaceae archaeon]|nr:DUF1673 family protein [Methanosarcinaceae archaeon]